MRQFFLNLREIFWTDKNFFVMTVSFFIFLFLSLKIFSFILSWFGAALTLVFIFSCSIIQLRYEGTIIRLISRADNWLLQRMHKITKRR